MARDGSDLERIAGHVAFPTWSPNGAWILFRSERSGSFGTLLRARSDAHGAARLVMHTADPRARDMLDDGAIYCVTGSDAL